MNMATFFDQTKRYSTQKKKLFQMDYFKFHEKNYWESSKLTDSKITPSRENHAHFIPCKPPHKNHPTEYFRTTLWLIQIATSVLEKSQILSVAFHLSATVCTALHDHYHIQNFWVSSLQSPAQKVWRGCAKQLPPLSPSILCIRTLGALASPSKFCGSCTSQFYRYKPVL